MGRGRVVTLTQQVFRRHCRREDLFLPGLKKMITTGLKWSFVNRDALPDPLISCFMAGSSYSEGNINS